MRTFSLKNLILPALTLIFLSGCRPSKKLSVPGAVQTLPELPVSEIDIPVTIAAKPILDKVEKTVPAEFTSEGWPAFLQPSCDFRYKYRFVRSALQVTCVNNNISIHFSGNYQVGGSKSLCTAGIPVSPWITGGCGFPPQPLRKVNMGLHSTLQFLPGYRMRTTTTITGIQPVDKCQVSIFSNDITQLVMDSIRSSLATFSSGVDQTMAGLDFTKIVHQVGDSSYHKVSLGRYGYILVNPTGLRIGQLNYAKDSFNISFGISCKPLMTSDPANPSRVPGALPPLLQTDNRNGVKLYLNMQYDYAFLTRLLQDSLHNKVFEVKGRTLVVKDATISGGENNQINIRVDFAGSNHGSIFLKGTPVLDTAKQTLGIPDISYSLEGEDLALKIVRSLFRNKIRKTIQGKSYLDIAALVTANRLLIDQQLNRGIIKGLTTRGYVKEAKMIGLLATRNNIQVQLFILADVSIAAGNL